MCTTLCMGEGRQKWKHGNTIALSNVWFQTGSPDAFATSYPQVNCLTLTNPGGIVVRDNVTIVMVTLPLCWESTLFSKGYAVKCEVSRVTRHSASNLHSVLYAHIYYEVCDCFNFLKILLLRALVFISLLDVTPDFFYLFFFS